MPEGRGVFPNLTVRENLLMWTYRGGVKRRRGRVPRLRTVPEAFSRRKQLAGTLSGGEQQMLAVARALVGRPRLLLLDEISMGLAPLVVLELFEVVRQLASEGITIVLAEQFVHTALVARDRRSHRRPRKRRALRVRPTICASSGGRLHVRRGQVEAEEGRIQDPLSIRITPGLRGEARPRQPIRLRG